MNREQPGLNIDFSQTTAEICGKCGNDTFVQVFKIRKLSEIRQIIANSGSREFDDLFKYIYDKSNTLFGDNEGEAILIIAQYQYEYTFVLEKEICIAAMLKKLLEIC